MMVAVTPDEPSAKGCTSGPDNDRQPASITGSDSTTGKIHVLFMSFLHRNNYFFLSMEL